MAVGATTLSFVFAIVLGISGAVAQRGTVALGASTTLTIIAGEVRVSHDGGATFVAAADGDILGAGDTIRTADGSRAVLTYFEGSTVAIEPLTELTIDQAAARPDGGTAVVMTQSVGRTWHVVTKLIGAGSTYEVRTPAATASVRGTQFEVGVTIQPDGDVTTNVITGEGIVATSAPATTAEPAPLPVLVTAGLQTHVKKSEAKPEAPTPAPEPQRKLTVTVADENSLVIDAQGRANGFKNGKVVVQTPGAKVERVNGELVVTLPDPTDGTVATRLGERSEKAKNKEEVSVTTTVEETGKQPVRVERHIRTANGDHASGVRIAKGDARSAGSLTVATDRLPTAKVGEAPKLGQETSPRLGLGGLVRTAEAAGATTEGAKKAEEQKKSGDQGSEQGPRPVIEAPKAPAAGEGITTAPAGGRAPTTDEDEQKKQTGGSGGGAAGGSGNNGGTPGAQPPFGRPGSGGNGNDGRGAPVQGGGGSNDGPKPVTNDKPAGPAEGPRPGFVPELRLPTLPGGEKGGPGAGNNDPKPEAPKPEAPKPEAPKPEAPKPEAPKPEAPKPEAPAPRQPEGPPVRGGDRATGEKGSGRAIDIKGSQRSVNELKVSDRKR